MAELGPEPDAWVLRPEPKSFSVLFSLQEPRTLAFSNPEVRGPQSSALSIMSRAASGLCGEGDGSRDSTSRRDMGSSPELGRVPAKVPDIQPAMKDTPLFPATLHREGQALPRQMVSRWLFTEDFPRESRGPRETWAGTLLQPSIQRAGCPLAALQRPEQIPSLLGLFLHLS